MKNLWNKFKATKGYRVVKIIMDSASFALFLSVAFFAYEMSEGKRETEEVVNNLMEIQNSLSTRYLGLFPEYISSINTLLEEALEHQKTSKYQDSIIIFEDVLYYGIRSDAEGFRRMNHNILLLAHNGCHVTIAHYDPHSIPFNQMVKDGLIESNYLKAQKLYLNNYRSNLKKFNQECKSIQHAPHSQEPQESFLALAKKYFPEMYQEYTRNSNSNVLMRINDFLYMDSISCELYFDSTKIVQEKQLQAKIKGYLIPIPQDKNAKDGITLQVNQMCLQLDSVMHTYLNKPYDEIHYVDFKNMYNDMTNTIAQLYKTQPNIELLPLNESLMMSCWLTKIGDSERAIFAFPSKYSTEEIGFVSQDRAFSDYIHTMLNGIKNNAEIHNLQ